MRILVDAMGGDNAPAAAALGAIRAAEALGTEVVLVGRGEEILKALADHQIQTLPKGVEIANAEDVVDMHDDPATVLKKEAAVLNGRRLADAARRRRGRIRVRRIYGGAALGGDADGAACEGHPPRGHGADYPDGHGKRHAHRLRRDGGLHAGISAAIRIHGIVLRAEAARRGAAARGAFEHRHGGQQGRRAAKAVYPLLQKAGDAGYIHFIGNIEARDCRSAERTWSWRTASPATCC